MSLIAHLFFLPLFFIVCFGQQKDTEILRFGNEELTVEFNPKTLSFLVRDPAGKILLPPHPISGIILSEGRSDSASPLKFRMKSLSGASLRAELETQSGSRASLELLVGEGYLNIRMQPNDKSHRLDMAVRTASMAPVYGLGDHGGYEGKTELTGFHNTHFINDRTKSHNWNHYRFISTFAIFPANGVAQVVFDEKEKQVIIDQGENRIGVVRGNLLNAYYFFGPTKKLYATYRKIREKEGYSSLKPKFEFFELGYEAFGSLGWNTYQSSVQEDIDSYLTHGYPIRWAVVGSGFWKGERRKPSEGSTTSFGIWDSIPSPSRNDGLPNPRYPDPAGMKHFFRERGIKLLLGSRINFKAFPERGGNHSGENDGSFLVEGLEKGYFESAENGQPEIYRVNVPAGNNHLLETDSPAAIQWFVDRFERWGADGIKEDLMLQDGVLLSNDAKQNPVNEEFMKRGKMVMVRNSAYGVPGDVLRLEDTMYGTDQDRPVINSLNYAFSGVGNIYPDIVAGKYLSAPLTEDQKRYFVRNAMLVSVMPVMSMGFGPWNLKNDAYEATVKKAVALHDELTPYIYSEVVRGFETGYPFALTPLPLAFPRDTSTFYLGDTLGRQYEWLIGESLLATPVYGNDYAHAASRDIYLPSGKWMDWESGEVFTGGTFYPDFGFPDSKSPLFIGGKDCIVLRKEGKMLLYYFPLNFLGESYEFIFPDGISRTTILTPKTKAESYFAIESEKSQAIQWDPDRKGFFFEIQPNKTYRISSN